MKTLRTITPIALALISATVLATALSQAVSPSTTSDPIAALVQQIDAANHQHATVEALGRLWLNLAAAYQKRNEFSASEAAYTRALPLLQTAPAQTAYAVALDGLGAIYLATGRVHESEVCCRKALAIHQAEGDRRRTAVLHENLSMVLFVEKDFAGAEAESSEALRELQSLDDADPADIICAMLTHSYAICSSGRCYQAIDETARAIALAKAAPLANSLVLSAAWLASGVVQWKSGLIVEAGQAMRESFRIVSEETDLPHAALVGAQVGVLRQYAQLLNATHQKPEARRISAQIDQLSAQPSGRPSDEQQRSCLSCTVNVNALAMPPR